MTEEEYLERLKACPDGFAKAWGYMMYGAMVAIREAKKRDC